MAGIDVNKKRLAVVVADVEVEDEYQFERRWYLRPAPTNLPAFHAPSAMIRRENKHNGGPHPI
jgi:hypothetical protein